MITNSESGTNIHEVAEGIYRIHTPLPAIPGGFSFNQYLVLDDEPLLFHTGLKRLFPLVREAIERVMPIDRLRYVAFSHFESDECGSLNEFLAVAPAAIAVASRIAVMTSLEDFASRPPRALADGEEIPLGRHTVRWMDAPHVPHGWETGFLFEQATRTLLCGDLFTQGGNGEVPLTESDILGPAEDLRRVMDAFSHSRDTPAILEKLAATNPLTLACMHGSAWRGDGAALLREQARLLSD